MPQQGSSYSQHDISSSQKLLKSRNSDIKRSKSTIGKTKFSLALNETQFKMQKNFQGPKPSDLGFKLSHVELNRLDQSMDCNDNESFTLNHSNYRNSYKKSSENLINNSSSNNTFLMELIELKRRASPMNDMKSLSNNYDIRRNHSIRNERASYSNYRKCRSQMANHSTSSIDSSLGNNNLKSVFSKI